MLLKTLKAIKNLIFRTAMRRYRQEFCDVLKREYGGTWYYKDGLYHDAESTRTARDCGWEE